MAGSTKKPMMIRKTRKDHECRKIVAMLFIIPELIQPNCTLKLCCFQNCNFGKKVLPLLIVFLDIVVYNTNTKKLINI